jgi:hypothetical protein
MTDTDRVSETMCVSDVPQTMDVVEHNVGIMITSLPQGFSHRIMFHTIQNNVELTAHVFVNLRNEELYNLYSSTSTTRMIKPIRTCSTLEAKRNACGI